MSDKHGDVEHTVQAKVGGTIRIDSTIQESESGAEEFFCYLTLPGWADAEVEVPPHVGLTMDRLDALINALQDVRARRQEEIARRELATIYKPRGVETWLSSQNWELEGWPPINLIRAGRSDAVLAEIERLTTGTAT